MSGANQIHVLYRGESRQAAVDFGENTAGLLTGPLGPGDTVASATLSIAAKPTGADDLTLGAASVIATTEYINGRTCSSGEAVLFRVTAASDQAYGDYDVLVTATTANSDTIPRTVRFQVVPL